MLAIVVVRDGVLPLGAAEVVAEAGGRVLLIGSSVADAVDPLVGIADEAIVIEAGSFAPGAWARGLADQLADEHHLVLPASPDGRDLAPRLAAALGRPLRPNCVAISTDTITMVAGGGTLTRRCAAPAAFVATLQAGVRAVHARPTAAPVATRSVAWVADTNVIDAEVTEVLAPDAASIDLGEARRILGGGAGLDSAARFDQLTTLGAALDASVGATRVITDRGWIEHQRQIGTTGVVVDPQLYLAFGVSGAVQHTSGLGQPEHIVSVNIDPHCPMMQMADLAVVADANEVLDELLAALGTPREVAS